MEANVMFRRSSPGGGTSWTSNNYSVWLNIFNNILNRLLNDSATNKNVGNLKQQ